MKGQKVTSLASYRNRDTEELIGYLGKRCKVDDLKGLFVVSVDPSGKLRAHASGCCNDDLDDFMGKLLTLAMRRAAVAGGDGSRI